MESGSSGDIPLRLSNSPHNDVDLDDMATSRQVEELQQELVGDADPFNAIQFNNKFSHPTRGKQVERHQWELFIIIIIMKNLNIPSFLPRNRSIEPPRHPVTCGQCKPFECNSILATI